MRRPIHSRSGRSAIVDAAQTVMERLLRYALSGGRHKAQAENQPDEKPPPDKRWIKHPFWKLGFYFDLLFIVVLFPLFLRDLVVARRKRSRLRRGFAKQARIRRYRARAAMMDRSRRR